MPATRGRPARHPADLTGREDDRLRRENADAIEQAGATMALAGGTAARKTSKTVTDYTDAARPKVSPVPVAPISTEPREYVVRLVASIENMTFGKDVVDPGEYDEQLRTYTRAPQVGALKHYDFTEGRLYKVDEPLYLHLKELGYLYDEDEAD
jgi:hypothetical protein